MRKFRHSDNVPAPSQLAGSSQGELPMQEQDQRVATHTHVYSQPGTSGP